jgi:hypothetical protein
MVSLGPNTLGLNATKYSISQMVNVNSNKLMTCSIMVKPWTGTNFRIVAANSSGTLLGGVVAYSSLSTTSFSQVSFTFTSPGNGDIYIYIGGSDATDGAQINGTVYLYGLVIYTGNTASTNIQGSMALTSTVKARDYLFGDGNSLTTA